MSFNVGSGFLNAHISHERLHDIRKNESLPEMTLWEKIKDFFFSTHQKAALECVHKLYHRDDFNMSEQEVHETFIKLRELASPGCKNKFTIDRSIYADVYKIDSEVILSLPKSDLHEHRTWSDSDSEDIWHDYHNEQETELDISSWHESDISAPENISLSTESIALSTERNVSSADDAYIQSIKILKPKIEESIHKIGAFKISDSIGYFQSIKALAISSQIIKNLREQNDNKQEFNSNIDALLKIPGLLDLVPPEIARMPEFAVILRNFSG